MNLRALLAAAVTCGALVVLPACSLISLKTPEKPLSPRDLNARILTRDYSGRFIAGVADTADVIAAQNDSSAARRDALRWKIGASVASETAATQVAPFIGLLDTWALSVQMRDFLSDGAGKDLFGPQQSLAVARATDLATEAEGLVRRLTAPEEFERARVTVNRYARANPLTSTSFSRASIAETWSEELGAKTPLADTMGTIPEALGNVGDVVRVYGSNGSSQLIWSAQLAAQDSGVSSKDVEAALKRLDQRVGEFEDLARSAPEQFNTIMTEMRTGLDQSLAELRRAMHAEETNFFAALNEQREAATATIDAQRAAVAADASRLADQVLRTAGEEARRIIRDTLLFATMFVIILLGLPFAAGYWVGRVRGGVRPGAGGAA